MRPGTGLYSETTCADVPNYSVQLRFAGVCNAQDTLAASGTLLTGAYGDRAATRKPRGVRLASLQLTRPTAGASGAVLATLRVSGRAALPGGTHVGSILLTGPGWRGRPARLPKRDDDRDGRARQPQPDPARAAGRHPASGDGSRLRDPRRLPARLARSALVNSRALSLLPPPRRRPGPPRRASGHRAARAVNRCGGRCASSWHATAVGRAADHPAGDHHRGDAGDVGRRHRGALVAARVAEVGEAGPGEGELEDRHATAEQGVVAPAACRAAGSRRPGATRSRPAPVRESLARQASLVVRPTPRTWGAAAG